MNHVSRIHQSQSNSSINRGSDVAIGQVQPGVFDLRLVSAYQAFLLRHGGFLSVVLLLGDHSLLVKVGITLQVAFGIFEVRLVLEFRRLSLSNLHLVRPRVNGREFITLVNLLPFPKVNLH